MECITREQDPAIGYGPIFPNPGPRSPRAWSVPSMVHISWPIPPNWGPWTRKPLLIQLRLRMCCLNGHGKICRTCIFPTHPVISRMISPSSPRFLLPKSPCLMVKSRETSPFSPWSPAFPHATQRVTFHRHIRHGRWPRAVSAAW